jgi:hypothetical protein
MQISRQLSLGFFPHFVLQNEGLHPTGVKRRPGRGQVGTLYGLNGHGLPNKIDAATARPCPYITVGVEGERSATCLGVGEGSPNQIMCNHWIASHFTVTMKANYSPPIIYNKNGGLHPAETKHRPGKGWRGDLQPERTQAGRLRLTLRSYACSLTKKPLPYQTTPPAINSLMRG